MGWKGSGASALKTASSDGTSGAISKTIGAGRSPGQQGQSGPGGQPAWSVGRGSQQESATTHAPAAAHGRAFPVQARIQAMATRATNRFTRR